MLLTTKWFSLCSLCLCGEHALYPFKVSLDIRAVPAAGYARFQYHLSFIWINHVDILTAHFF
jgi:hypothetical protein